MVRVSERVQMFSDSNRRAREIRATNPNSTVARMTSMFEDNLLLIDGESAPSGGASPPSSASSLTSDGGARRDASCHQYPRVNRPSLYVQQQRLAAAEAEAKKETAERPPPPSAGRSPGPPTGSSSSSQESGGVPPRFGGNQPRWLATSTPVTATSASDDFLDCDYEEDEYAERPFADMTQSSPVYSRREPSRSSTIRSSSSSDKSRSSLALPALDAPARIQSNLRANPLPKAKVVIARRRHESIDFGVEHCDDNVNSAAAGGAFDPRTDAVSVPFLPSLFPNPDAEERGQPREMGKSSFPTGRASLINLMETNTESGALNDFRDADADFDEYKTVKGWQPNNRAPPRARVDVDEFMETEGLGVGIGEREQPYETEGERKPAKGRFLRRLAGKKEPAESRHTSKQEGIQRRSQMVSGAVERMSLAADPFIDFAVGTSSAPKGRFSRFMSRLFGQGAERKRIKGHS